MSRPSRTKSELRDVADKQTTNLQLRGGGGYRTHVAESGHALLGDPLRRGLQSASPRKVARDTDRAAHIAPEGYRRTSRRHQTPFPAAAPSGGTVEIPRVIGSPEYGVVALW